MGIAHGSSKIKSLVEKGVNQVDTEGNYHMSFAKQRCRCIKSSQIPFSPESVIWIERRQAHCSLLCYHGGKVRHRTNLKCTARRCGIKGLFQLPLVKIRARLSLCKKKCQYFQKYGNCFWCKHLNTCLKAARGRCNADVEPKILAIIKREKDCLF